MWLSLLKNILIVIILLALQLSFIPNLPGEITNLNLVLVFLVFISIAYNFYLAAVYAFFIGFISDIYSILPFGALLVALLVTLYLTYKVYENLLTNKSYYTMIGLITTASISYTVMLFLYNVSFKILWLNQAIELSSLISIWLHVFIWQIIYNIIAISIMFFTFHYFSRKFKTVFIDTTKA